MKRTVLIALATAVVLAACAALEEKERRPRETNVTVDEKQAYLVVDQEPIIVRGQDVTIVWRIATSGYEFPPDGVVFRDARYQFISCAPKGNIFQCLDRNTEKGRFKYTIKVRPTGTARAPHPLDPTVMND